MSGFKKLRNHAEKERTLLNNEDLVKIWIELCMSLNLFITAFGYPPGSLVNSHTEYCTHTKIFLLVLALSMSLPVPSEEWTNREGQTDQPTEKH